MIKYITLALFVAAVSSAPTQSANVPPCSEEEIAATSCKGPKDCLFPNPDNCNTYLQCEVNADNRTGTPIVRPCPADLEWNNIDKICDWPDKSTCPKNVSTTGSPSTEPSTQTPTTEPSSSPSPSSSGPISTEQSSSISTEESASKPSGGGSANIPPCSEEEIAATSCKGPKDCLFPNPDNCNTYLQCEVNADNRTGTPIVRPCPADLEWNDIDKICDWPDKSTCPKNVSTTGSPSTEPSTQTPTTEPSSSPSPSTSSPTSPEQTASPPTGNIPPCSEEEIAATSCKGPKDCLYPNPENCNTFIQCTVNADNRTGTPVVMPCPDGLEWNDIGKICDWPYNSTCPKNVSTTGPPSTEPSTQTPTTEPSSSLSPSTSGPTSTEETASPSTDPSSSPSPSTSSPTSPEETASPPTGNIPPCSEEEIAATSCKGPKDCLFPNPDNCNTYLQCEVNADNRTGTPIVRPCPAGLEWNDIDKICDWPDKSTCPRNVTTTAPSSSTGPENTSNAPENTTTTQQPDSSTLPVCRPEDDDNDSDLDLNQICGTECNSPRTVAHPKNNGKYIICSSSNSVRKCAPGLLYSKDQLSCTYAGLVDSNGPSNRS